MLLKNLLNPNQRHLPDVSLPEVRVKYQNEISMNQSFICFYVCFSAIFSCVCGSRFSAICAFFRRALILSYSIFM